MSVAEVTVTLAENEHVKELLDILKANGLNADAKGLAEVVGHVEAMQSEINKAIGEVTSMRRELFTMRDEQNHPIRTMLQKAADGLSSRLKTVQKCLSSLKDKIIGACKRTVEAFKDQGVAALNGAVVVFDIKHDLEVSRNAINNAIDYQQGQIAKIEAASAEMRAAGRSLKNVGRAFQGKEPIPDIKPGGILTRLVEAPFRSEIRSLKRSLGRVNKSLARIDKLEKAAALRAERGRPSTLKEIQEKQALIAEQKRDTPNRVKTAEAEI